MLFILIMATFLYRCNAHGAECDQCDSRFVTEWELKQHVKNTHGERLMKCDICGLGFNERCHLQDHINSHAGHISHVCERGKAYTFASGLSMHKRNCKV